MKRLLIFIFYFLLIYNSYSQTKELFFEQSNEFFKYHVISNGKINYSSLKRSPGELLYILENVSKINIDLENNETKLAFWINAYNLLVIKIILENYPIISVKKVPSFFETSQDIGGKGLSLNEIETLINSLITDPAKHFVLANGTNGGPKLSPAAYQPDSVIYNISYNLKTLINLDGYVKVNNEKETVLLPKVFDSYKSDFVTIYFNQIDFLNVFLKKGLNNKFKIDFYDYDWSLNDLK